MRKFFVVDGGEYVNPGPGTGAARAMEPDGDSVIESGLVLLLSEIAQCAEEITEYKDKQPAQVLKILSDMVNRAYEFTASAGITGPGSGMLEDAVSKSSFAVSQVGLLHVENDRLSAQTAINLHKAWTGPGSEKNQVFGRIAMGMVGILEHLLGSISPAFSSRKTAAEWSDAFTISTDELSCAVRSVTF